MAEDNKEIKKFTEMSADEQRDVISARESNGINGVGIVLAVNGSAGQSRTDQSGKITPETILSDLKDCVDTAETRGSHVGMMHFHSRTEDGGRDIQPSFVQGVLSKVKTVLASTKDIPIMNTSTSTHRLEEDRADDGRPKSLIPFTGTIAPEVASFTPGNFPDFGGAVYSNPPEKVNVMAKRMKDKGVCPEIEVFCRGNLDDLYELYSKGREQNEDGSWKVVNEREVLLADPVHIQLVIGAPGGKDDAKLQFFGSDGEVAKSELGEINVGDLPANRRPISINDVKNADGKRSEELDAVFRELIGAIKANFPDAKWSAFGIGIYRDAVTEKALEFTNESGPVVLRTGVEDGNVIYGKEGKITGVDNSTLINHLSDKLDEMRSSWQAAGISTDTLNVMTPGELRQALQTSQAKGIGNQI